MSRKLTSALACLALVVGAAACNGSTAGPGSGTGSPVAIPSASDASAWVPQSPFITPSPTASPTPVTAPTMPTGAGPSQGKITQNCVNGWIRPAVGSAQWNQPLAIISKVTGQAGPFRVAEMRYFVGPESPVNNATWPTTIQRWYVKLYATANPAFQGRFIVEFRELAQQTPNPPIAGPPSWTGAADTVAAVAPWDTTGFRSPNWVGFQWSQTVAKSYPGLPGTWRGTPYDFVKGGEGLKLPGLPSQVAGCMNGT